MNTNQSNSLEEQVGELRSRVRRLEEALIRQGLFSQEPRPQQPPAEQVSAPPIPGTYAAPEPVMAPSFGYSTPAAAEGDLSLESRIGSQWFNRIGIEAVLVGVAWFLKLAHDNHWIGRWDGC